MVSHKIVSSGKITVFDSLPPGDRMWSNRLNHLPEQLELVFGKIDKDSIEVKCPQKQGYNSYERNNSGLYALGNAMLLLNGENPCNFKFKKNMRGQLLGMITDNVLNLKLFETIRVSQSSQCTEKSVKMNKLTSTSSKETSDWQHISQRTPLVSMKKLGSEDSALNMCKNKNEILTQIYNFIKTSNQYSLLSKQPAGDHDVKPPAHTVTGISKKQSSANATIENIKKNRSNIDKKKEKNK